MKYIYFLALSVVFLSTTQSAYAQPAIEVWYGATQITDNQPSTVLLGTGYQGTNLDNTMQIRNTGTADLIIFSISVSGFNFSYVGATPPFTISAGGSRDFTVRFYNPGKAANTGAVLIETSIIGDNTFAFQTFARLTGPEVDVTRGTSTLPNSIQSVSVGETHNYGNVIQGASGSQAFSIHNTSPNNTLTISNVNVSGDFTLSSQVGTNTIATNSKTTFSVTFNTNMLGSKSGSVSFTTNDADEPNYTFPLAANVILPAPTTQATDLTFSNVTTTSMTVDWSNGNGVNRIVVAKEGSAVDAAPDDNTSYNADPDFGVGAEIGSGNFVVYNGNGSSVDITNLNPKIFYHFQVFEYNGSTGTEAYNTSVVSGSTDRRWAGQSFVTRWNTSRPGTSGTNRITIPTVGGGYNYDVDWEEVGTPANNGKFRGVSGDAIITFPSGGNYEVEISGNFPRVRFDNATDARRLSRIMQWGDIEWSSMEQAFVYCEYLDGTISDSPDLSDVTSTFMMFQFAAFFDEDVSSWNMSNINNMEGMFAQAVSFNNGGQPLDWGNSTAAVTNMEGLFTDASAFNQDVSDWNVSNVTNMSAMFWGASSFNRDISSWDVRSVTDMSNMLTGTTAFRNGSQPLDWLNTGMVTNMDAMFSSSGFNQDISGWDVSNVLTMNGMFRGASNFNQSLAAWDISSATNMTNMFDNCNMSMANYESTLLGWADDNGGTETINSNVTLGALNLRYTNNATGRQDLISTNNWNIIGDILLITPPTTQAANLNFTNISTNSMTVNWTNGDGANRIVVVREGNVVDFSPVDGQGYTADPNLTTSTDLGSGNFVVYNGAGSSVGVTGLYENTTYHFQVFEYNGTAGTEKYNLDTNPTNPLSESTIDLYTVINTDNSGVGSLRQAIINANASSGETITFKIPGGGPHVITPTTALPAITSPMTIDGYSQPGASVNTLAVGSDAVLLIEIDGVNINGDGLFINNISNCVIQGLSIHSFDGYGIGINGSLATNNSIRGCYIGVKTDGVTAPFPTTRQRGLQFNGAPNNFIGDGTAAGRNVISGNGNRSPGGGIDVNGSGSTGNQIQGNYIGVDLTGLINVGNYGIGVEIRNGASGNTVGGTNTLSRNIISGNQSEGINFNTGSLNIIIGNYIGVGADGISSIPNQYNGINVANNSTNNQIGGTAPGEANLIANNNGNGIEISSSTSLYNTISGNTIYSNSGNGISLSCGNNNKRFPVITTTTAGTITGTCESGDIIEVFDAGTGDEGQTFLGTALTTGSTWNLSGSFNISSNFTATATSANGSTSEFSRIDGSSPPGLVTPTTQVDGLTLSSFTGTSASLTWANGNGSGRLIVASTSPIIWTPIDGMAYTANSTYGSGVPVDTDTYVVYSGSGSSSSISGLTVSFAYYFKIFEFDVECSANYYNSNTTAGNSMITPPSGQATNLTFTNESTTSMTVNWTNGDGANRIVVAREGNVVDFSPVDGQSYTADPDLTTSTDLGSGNFVVYNDAGSSVGVTGLNENTTYHFQVFEYNGTAGSEIYNVSTATDNPANQITLYREISVFVGAIQITTGDTQSLASTVQPNDASQVFTINNTGTADLIVTAINMTDGSKYAVSGITFPNTIAAGLSTDFTLILDGNAAGTFTDQLTIVNNDGNFVINLSGIITATPVPAIEVTDGSTTLVANDNYTLTSTVQPNNASQVFTINNTGTADLIVTAINMTDGSKYTVSGITFPNTVAAGSSTDFTLTLDGSAAGTFTDQLTIVNNDANFVINLSGIITATPVPAIEVTDGSTTLSTNDNYTLTSTVQPNDASEVFTINNTGTADLIVTAINMTDGSKYAVSGITFPNTIAAGSSTDFTLTLDGSAAGTFTDQLTIVNNDANFVINLSGIITATPVPTIEVTDGSTTLVANDNYTLTSTVQPNDASQVFTINNTGTADLIVTAINLSDGTKYAVSGITFPNTVAAGSSTDFTLTLDGSAAGTFTDQLTIVNNDANFVINLSGIITATPVPAIEVTDGSTTLTTNDNYTLTSTVQPNDASQVFTINNTGTADLIVTAINMTDGSKYSVLGITFPNTIAAGSSTDFTLTLDGSAAGTFADQLTIANNDVDFVINLIGTISEAPSDVVIIEGEDNSGNIILANEDIDMGVTLLNVNIDKVFVIENLSVVDALTVNEITVDNPVFEVLSFSKTVPSKSFIQFTIRLNASAIGLYSTTVNVMTSINDFSFVVVGEVTSDDSPPLEIFNVVTPNGDGIHDFFNVKNLQLYPDNILNIYNRWGNKIFVMEGYDNVDKVFVGMSNTGDGELITGSYFYSIDKGDGSKVQTGYLFIKR